MEYRLFTIFVSVIIVVTNARNVSPARDDSTNSTESASYDDLPLSGDGNYGTTRDDEDGLYSEEYLEGDYDGYYGGSDDDDLYTYEESTNGGEEWEGFDGMSCFDGTRIGKRKICDGIPDCFDCSDEENCTDRSANIFMCYRRDEQPAQNYDYGNRKCIPLHKFCDGVPDCANGADEQKFDPGFKCQIKGKFRSCNLPDELICDDITHCEDESDVCKEILAGSAGIKANGTSDSQTSLSKAPEGFFRCLSHQIVISIHKLCDGVFDCPDLSDECLCEVRRSEIVEEVCTGMCAKRLWVDQAENPNCRVCSQGEILWKNATGNFGSEKKNCFRPSELFEILTRKQNASDQLLLEDDVIECVDQTLSFEIRARKCDGRPECFFGEDECNIGCSNGGKQDWVTGSGSSGDPPFCQLLTKELSFSCLSGMKKNESRNDLNNNLESTLVERHISVCDGVIECIDGSDEAFCPKRISCSPDSNDTDTPTFDETQRCDGVWNCANGEDEAQNCSYSTRMTSFPCDVKTREDENAEYFHVEDLLNDQKDCYTGADECPPFLSKIPQLLDKYFEGVPNRKKQKGISSHDRAMENLPLQIFTIAAAFIGVSALLVSFLLGLYNLTVPFRKFCKSKVTDRRLWIHNCLVCARELVVSIGMTASKILVCAYIAFLRIRRSEDINYSLHDLGWRSGEDCNAIGALFLVGAQVPLFILAFSAGSYLVLRKCCLVEGIKSIAENGRSEGEEIRKRNEPHTGRRTLIHYKLSLLFGCLGLTAVIWLPVVILALALVNQTNLHDRTQTYAWVRVDAASTVFRANLINQKRAATFASTILAMKNVSFPSPTEYFSFSKFEKILSTVVPSLGIRNYGSFGYFAHSGTCLPGFLVHVNGGEAPFDMAVSNSWTAGLSLVIFAIDLILVFVSIVLTTKYGSGICKFSCRKTQIDDRIQQHAILNHTFSRFVLIESLSWLCIIFLFFLKAVIGDGFSNYTYTVCCFVILCINCGIVTPFVLMTRKFRMLKTPRRPIVKHRPQSSPDFVEICEEDLDIEEQESEPLTNGTPGDQATKESNNNKERESLMQTDETAAVDYLST